MKNYILLLIAGFMMNSSAENIRAAEPNDTVSLTVMYDNYIHDNLLQAEWGFSCLIEGAQETILFDTGGDANVLEANFKKLNKDPNKIDIVVISHMHWDHINGLEWLMKENNHLKIFLPDSAPKEIVKDMQEQAKSAIPVSETMCIAEGIFSTGTLQQVIPEQSICLETDKGLVVITGCSHPGIVRILKKAKELSGQQIYFAFGGFHLRGNTPEQIEKIIEEIKALGVKKIGPTHCTGDSAIEMFKEAWEENYISIGAGKTIQLNLKKHICGI